MKKALSLLLAGVMCVGLLAGCGGQNTEDTQGSGSTPDTSSTQETGNKTIDTLRKFTDEETAHDPRFTFQQER